MSSYLVLGATSGIGAAIVDDLLSNGHRVIAVGRNSSVLEELKSRSVQIYQRDLSIPEQRVLLWEELLSQRPLLDHVVYAAGIAIRGTVDVMDAGDLRKMFEINTLAALELMQWCSFLHPGSTLTLFSSNLAQHPLGNTVGYSATKAALEVACRASAYSFGAKGIRINAIAPGPVDTPMLRHQFEGSRSIETCLDELGRFGPLQRIGTVEDVVEAFRYVIHSSWLTGQVVTIDGGFSCPQ